MTSNKLFENSKIFCGKEPQILHFELLERHFLKISYKFLKENCHLGRGFCVFLIF